jgi:hypothetical protein
MRGNMHSNVVCRTQDNINRLGLRFKLCLAGRCVFSLDEYSYPEVPTVESVYGCPVDDSEVQGTRDCPTWGGGHRLTVTGTGFLLPMSVLVGGRQCGSIERANDTYFTCNVPANAGVDLSLTVKAGRQRTEARNRVSFAAPVIEAIQGCRFVSERTVRECDRNGGDLIELTGRNFGQSHASVTIGSQACLNVTHDILSPHTKVSCVAPAGTMSDRPVALLQRLGTVSVSTILLSYEQCPPGTFARDTACDLCPPGGFNDLFSQTSCRLCPAGSYSDGSGASACRACKAGTYSGLGAAACVKCPRGFFSHANAEKCTQCAPGTFGLNEGSSSCETCPLGAESIEDHTYCHCATGMYMDKHGACVACMAGGDCTSPGTTIFNIVSLPRFSPSVLRTASEHAVRLRVTVPATGVADDARRTVRSAVTGYLFGDSSIPRARVTIAAITLSMIPSATEPAAAGNTTHTFFLREHSALTDRRALPSVAVVDVDVYPSTGGVPSEESAAALAQRVADAATFSMSAPGALQGTVVRDADYTRGAIHSFELCVNSACRENNVCREGHGGALCTVCLPGYGRSSSFDCGKCNPPALRTFILVASILAAIVVCSVLVWKQIADGKRSMNELPAPAVPILLKVATSGLQVMSIAARYDLQWPGALAGVFDTTDTAGGVGTAFLSLDCFLTESSVIRPFWVTTISIMLLPLAGVILPALVFFPLYLRKRHVHVANLITRAAQERATAAEAIEELKAKKEADRAAQFAREEAERNSMLVWENVNDRDGLDVSRSRMRVSRARMGASQARTDLSRAREDVSRSRTNHSRGGGTDYSRSGMDLFVDPALAREFAEFVDVSGTGRSPRPLAPPGVPPVPGVVIGPQSPASRASALSGIILTPRAPISPVQGRLVWRERFNALLPGLRQSLSQPDDDYSTSRISMMPGTLIAAMPHDVYEMSNEPSYTSSLPTPPLFAFAPEPFVSVAPPRPTVVIPEHHLIEREASKTQVSKTRSQRRNLLRRTASCDDQQASLHSPAQQASRQGFFFDAQPTSPRSFSVEAQQAAPHVLSVEARPVTSAASFGDEHVALHAMSLVDQQAAIGACMLQDYTEVWHTLADEHTVSQDDNRDQSNVAFEPSIYLDDNADDTIASEADCEDSFAPTQYSHYSQDGHTLADESVRRASQSDTRGDEAASRARASFDASSSYSAAVIRPENVDLGDQVDLRPAPKSASDSVAAEVDDYIYMMREHLKDSEADDAWLLAHTPGVTDASQEGDASGNVTPAKWDELFAKSRTPWGAFDDARIRADAVRTLAAAKTTYEIAHTIQNAQDMQNAYIVQSQRAGVVDEAEILRADTIERERAAQRVRASKQLLTYCSMYGAAAGKRLCDAARKQASATATVRLTLSEARRQVVAAEYSVNHAADEFIGYFITAVNVVMFLIHPNITKQFFLILSCKRVGGTEDPGATFLLSDITEPCYSSHHVLFIFAIGIPMFVLWVFGIPFFAWLILYRNRGLIQAPMGVSSVVRMQKKIFESQMAFMYRGYKPSRYYWFLVEMGRKIALVGIAVFFPGALHTQLLLASLLIFCCIIAQIAAQPFENRIPGAVEFLSLGTSFMIFFLANFLFVSTVSGEAKTVITVMIVSLIGMFLLVVVVAFVVLIRQERGLEPLRRLLREAQILGQDPVPIIRNWRLKQVRRPRPSTTKARRSSFFAAVDVSAAASQQRHPELEGDSKPQQYDHGPVFTLKRRTESTWAGFAASLESAVQHEDDVLHEIDAP